MSGGAPVIAPSAPGWRAAALVIPAIVLGLGAGFVVSIDHVVSLLDPVRSVGRLVPYLLSIAVVVIAVAATVLVVGRAWFFQHRFALALAAVLVAGATSGANLGPVDLTDLAMLGVAAFWLATALVERHPIRLPIGLLVLILLLIACSLASIFNGGFGSVIAQRTFVNKCLLILAVTSLVATAGLSPFAVRLLAALAVVSALLALGSMTTFLTTGLTLTAEDLEEYRHKLTPLGLLPRATAFMPTTQSLAHLLLLGLSLVLCIPMRTWMRLLAAPLIVFGIGCTFSLGAYVALSIVLLLWPFVRWPHRSIHFLTGLALAAVIAYYSGLADWVYETVVMPVGAKGALDRITYLQAGIATIIEHPYFGIGLRQIGRVLPTPVHNAYIQLTAELGIPAGVLFAMLVLSTTVGAGYAAFRRTTGAPRMITTGLFLGMIALAVHFVFEPFYDNYVSWVYIGIVAGTLAALPPLPIARRLGPRRSGSNGWPAVHENGEGP